MTAKEVNAAIEVFLVLSTSEVLRHATSFFLNCIRRLYIKHLLHEHNILNIKITSAARSSMQKFDNDGDVIFMFKM